jgi:lipoprotein-releasing system permease protein
VSVTAIMVGTAALIIILSAFNGFETLVKSLYTSFYSDLKIRPKLGKTLQLNKDQIKKLQGLSGVRLVSLVAEEKGLLQNGSLQSVVVVKGVDSFYTSVSGVSSKMARGNFDLGSKDEPKAVMGIGIENAIGILADRSLFPITLYMPKQGVKSFSNPLEALSQGSITPSGSFAIQQEFDNKYLFTNIGFVKQYLNYGEDEYSGAEFILVDPASTEKVQKQIQNLGIPNSIVENRFEQNQSLYSTILLEKWAIYFIFSLILLVASFNMIGALSMLVLEKQKDIQVLMAMGASSGVIRKIFMLEGLLLAAIGTVAGVLIALTLYYLQINYHLVPLEGESFLISYYPVELHLADFLLVIVTVFMIGLLASWYPAIRASKEPIQLG